MKNKYKTLSLRLITALMLVSLTLVGSDCEDIINQIGGPTGDITGQWQLIYNAGTTNDICPGETVNFPSSSSGTATLTCPNVTPITRNYTISGSTLTYTATSVEYQVQFTQNNELVLTGINNNRILYYSQQISDKVSKDNAGKNAPNFNSSELK
jgi:hypothetical protein